MRTWQSEHKNQVFTAALGGCGSVSMVGSQQTEWAGFSLLPPLCLMLDRHARLTNFLLCNFSYFVKMFVLLSFFPFQGPVQFSEYGRFCAVRCLNTRVHREYLDWCAIDQSLKKLATHIFVPSLFTVCSCYQSWSNQEEIYFLLQRTLYFRSQ